MIIPDSFLRDAAYSADGFEDGPTLTLYQTNRAVVDHTVQQALFRAFEVVRSLRFADVEVEGVDDAGLTVRCTHHHMARSCHVGSSTYCVTLTWPEVLDPNGNPSALVTERWEAQAAAERAAKDAAYRTQREAEERRTLEQLQAKYPS